MAKAKDEFDDFDDLSEFDDLDNFDFEAKEPEPGEPAYRKMLIGKYLGAVGGGILSGIKKSAESELSESSDVVSEIGDWGSDLSETWDTLKDAASETIEQGRKTVKQLLPSLRKLMPQRLYGKLEDYLSDVDLDEEKQESPEKAQERMENESIQSVLGEVFSEQLAEEKRENIDEKIQQTKRDAIESKRFAADYKVLTSVDQRIYQLSTFMAGPYTNYLKKSLEVSYRQYFTQKSILQLNKATFKMVEAKLEELKLNTSLPDANKAESTKKRLPRKMANQNIISNFRENLLGRIKESALEKLNQAKEGLGTLGDFLGMGADFGMTKEYTWHDILSGALKMGVGHLANKAMTSVINDNDQTRNFLELGARRLRTNLYSALAGPIANKLKNGPGWISWLADMIPKGSSWEDTKVTNDFLSKRDKAAQFDELTKRSIVEIIPAHLERVGDMVEALKNAIAPDQPVVQRTFDHETGMLVDANVIKRKMLESYVGTQAQHQAASRANLGFLVSAMSENAHGEDNVAVRNIRTFELKHKHTTEELNAMSADDRKKAEEEDKGVDEYNKNLEKEARALGITDIAKHNAKVATYEANFNKDLEQINEHRGGLIMFMNHVIHAPNSIWHDASMFRKVFSRLDEVIEKLQKKYEAEGASYPEGCDHDWPFSAANIDDWKDMLKFEGKGTPITAALKKVYQWNPLECLWTIKLLRLALFKRSVDKDGKVSYLLHAPTMHTFQDHIHRMQTSDDAKQAEAATELWRGWGNERFLRQAHIIDGENINADMLNMFLNADVKATRADAEADTATLDKLIEKRGLLEALKIHAKLNPKTKLRPGGEEHELFNYDEEYEIDIWEKARDFVEKWLMRGHEELKDKFSKGIGGGLVSAGDDLYKNITELRKKVGDKSPFYYVISLQRLNSSLIQAKLVFGKFNDDGTKVVVKRDKDLTLNIPLDKPQINKKYAKKLTSDEQKELRNKIKSRISEKLFFPDKFEADEYPDGVKGEFTGFLAAEPQFEADLIKHHQLDTSQDIIDNKEISRILIKAPGEETVEESTAEPETPRGSLLQTLVRTQGTQEVHSQQLDKSVLLLSIIQQHTKNIATLVAEQVAREQGGLGTVELNRYRDQMVNSSDSAAREQLKDNLTTHYSTTNRRMSTAAFKAMLDSMGGLTMSQQAQLIWQEVAQGYFNPQDVFIGLDANNRIIYRIDNHIFVQELRKLGKQQPEYAAKMREDVPVTRAMAMMGVGSYIKLDREALITDALDVAKSLQGKDPLAPESMKLLSNELNAIKKRERREQQREAKRERSKQKRERALDKLRTKGAEFQQSIEAARAQAEQITQDEARQQLLPPELNDNSSQPDEEDPEKFALEKAATWLHNTLSSGIDSAQDLYDKIASLPENMVESVIKVYQNNKEHFGHEFKALGGVTVQALTDLKDWAAEKGQAGVGVAKSLYEGMKGKYQAKKKQLEESWQNSKTKQALDNAKENVTAYATQANWGEVAGKYMTSFREAMEDYQKKLSDKLLPKFDELVENTKSIPAAAWYSFKSSPMAIEFFDKYYSPLKSWVHEKVENVKKWALGGPGAMTGVRGFLRNIFSKPSLYRLKSLGWSRQNFDVEKLKPDQKIHIGWFPTFCGGLKLEPTKELYDLFEAAVKDYRKLLKLADNANHGEDNLAVAMDIMAQTNDPAHGSYAALAKYLVDHHIKSEDVENTLKAYYRLIEVNGPSAEDPDSMKHALRKRWLKLKRYVSQIEFHGLAGVVAKGVKLGYKIIKRLPLTALVGVARKVAMAGLKTVTKLGHKIIQHVKHSRTLYKLLDVIGIRLPERAKVISKAPWWEEFCKQFDLDPEDTALIALLDNAANAYARVKQFGLSSDIALRNHFWDCADKVRQQLIYENKLDDLALGTVEGDDQLHQVCAMCIAYWKGRLNGPAIMTDMMQRQLDKIDRQINDTLTANTDKAPRGAGLVRMLLGKRAADFYKKMMSDGDLKLSDVADGHTADDLSDDEDTAVTLGKAEEVKLQSASAQPSAPNQTTSPGQQLKQTVSSLINQLKQPGDVDETHADGTKTRYTKDKVIEFDAAGKQVSERDYKDEEERRQHWGIASRKDRAAAVAQKIRDRAYSGMASLATRLRSSSWLNVKRYLHKRKGDVVKLEPDGTQIIYKKNKVVIVDNQGGTTVRDYMEGEKEKLFPENNKANALIAQREQIRQRFEELKKKYPDKSDRELMQRARKEVKEETGSNWTLRKVLGEKRAQQLRAARVKAKRKAAEFARKSLDKLKGGVARAGSMGMNALRGAGHLAGKVLSPLGSLATSGLGLIGNGVAALPGMGGIVGTGALLNPVTAGALALAAGGFAAYKGIKGSTVGQTAKDFGIKGDDVTGRDRWARGLGQALTFGLGGKGATKFADELIENSAFSAVPRLYESMKHAMGEEVAVTDKDLDWARRKLKERIDAGDRQAELDLQQFEAYVKQGDRYEAMKLVKGGVVDNVIKTVGTKMPGIGLGYYAAKKFGQWAGQAFGITDTTKSKVASLRKELEKRAAKDKTFKKVLQEYDDKVQTGALADAVAFGEQALRSPFMKGLTNTIGFIIDKDNLGGTDKPLTADEIKQAVYRFDVRIKKGDKVAATTKQRFIDAVQKQDWETARAISGNTRDGWGMSAVKAGLRLLGVGALINSLASNEDRPMTKSQIEARTKKFQEQIKYWSGRDPKQADKYKQELEKFADAVNSGNWRVANQLAKIDTSSDLAKAVTWLGKQFISTTDSNKPMTKSEIDRFRKRIANQLKRAAEKNDDAATRQLKSKLERFNDAVMNEKWPVARNISQTADTGSIYAGVRGATDVLFGLNSSPMTPADIERYRGKVKQRIENLKQSSLDGKDAIMQRLSKELEKFEDAVAKEDWVTARRISRQSKDGLITAAAKGIWNVTKDWVFGSNDTPMTGKEITGFRNKMQSDIERCEKRDPQRATMLRNKLAKFEDAILASNWKQARAIANMPNSGIIGMTLNAIGGAIKMTSDWLWGNDANPMTLQELEEARKKFNELIQQGNPRAKERLEAFEQAVSEGRWQRARNISNIHQLGILKQLGKGLGNLWDNAFTTTINKTPMTEEEIERYRYRFNMEIASGNKVAKNKSVMFEKFIQQGKWADARAAADLNYIKKSWMLSAGIGIGRALGMIKLPPPKRGLHDFSLKSLGVDATLCALVGNLRQYADYKEMENELVYALERDGVDEDTIGKIRQAMRDTYCEGGSTFLMRDNDYYKKLLDKGDSAIRDTKQEKEVRKETAKQVAEKAIARRGEMKYEIVKELDDVTITVYGKSIPLSALVNFDEYYTFAEMFEGAKTGFKRYNAQHHVVKGGPLDEASYLGYIVRQLRNEFEPKGTDDEKLEDDWETNVDYYQAYLEQHFRRMSFGAKDPAAAEKKLREQSGAIAAGVIQLESGIKVPSPPKKIGQCANQTYPDLIKAITGDIDSKYGTTLGFGGDKEKYEWCIINLSLLKIGMTDGSRNDRPLYEQASTFDDFVRKVFFRARSIAARFNLDEASKVEKFVNSHSRKGWVYNMINQTQEPRLKIAAMIAGAFCVCLMSDPKLLPTDPQLHEYCMSSEKYFKALVTGAGVDTNSDPNKAAQQDKRSMEEIEKESAGKADTMTAAEYKQKAKKAQELPESVDYLNPSGKLRSAERDAIAVIAGQKIRVHDLIDPQRYANLTEAKADLLQGLQQRGLSAKAAEDALTKWTALVTGGKAKLEGDGTWWRKNFLKSGPEVKAKDKGTTEAKQALPVPKTARQSSTGSTTTTESDTAKKAAETPYGLTKEDLEHAKANYREANYTLREGETTTPRTVYGIDLAKTKAKVQAIADAKAKGMTPELKAKIADAINIAGAKAVARVTEPAEGMTLEQSRQRAFIMYLRSELRKVKTFTPGELPVVSKWLDSPDAPKYTDADLTTESAKQATAKPEIKEVLKTSDTRASSHITRPDRNQSRVEKYYEEALKDPEFKAEMEKVSSMKTDPQHPYKRDEAARDALRKAMRRALNKHDKSALAAKIYHKVINKYLDKKFPLQSHPAAQICELAGIAVPEDAKRLREEFASHAANNKTEASATNETSQTASAEFTAPEATVVNGKVVKSGNNMGMTMTPKLHQIVKRWLKKAAQDTQVVEQMSKVMTTIVPGGADPKVFWQNNFSNKVKRYVMENNRAELEHGEMSTIFAYLESDQAPKYREVLAQLKSDAVKEKQAESAVATPEATASTETAIVSGTVTPEATQVLPKPAAETTAEAAPKKKSGNMPVSKENREILDEAVRILTTDPKHQSFLEKLRNGTNDSAKAHNLKAKLKNIVWQIISKKYEDKPSTWREKKNLFIEMLIRSGSYPIDIDKICRGEVSTDNKANSRTETVSTSLRPKYPPVAEERPNPYEQQQAEFMKLAQNVFTGNATNGLTPAEQQQLQQFMNEMNQNPNMTSEQTDQLLRQKFPELWAKMHPQAAAGLQQGMEQNNAVLKESPQEYAASFDRYGKRIAFRRGNHDNVRLPTKPGGTIVHTHPQGTGPSFADMQTAAETQQAKLVTIPMNNNAELLSPLNSLDQTNAVQLVTLQQIAQNLMTLINVMRQHNQAMDKKVMETAETTFNSAVQVSQQLSSFNKQRLERAKYQAGPVTVNKG